MLQFVKDLHISFISSTETAMGEIISVLSHYHRKIMRIFEPTFIEIIHHIDTTFWASSRKLIGEIEWNIPNFEALTIVAGYCRGDLTNFWFVADFIYARKTELMNSPYLLRSSNFTQQLDAIYKDLLRNDFMTNVKKYFSLLMNVVYEYYLAQIPYSEWIMKLQFLTRSMILIVD